MRYDNRKHPDISDKILQVLFIGGIELFKWIIEGVIGLLSERKKNELEMDRDFKRSKPMKEKKIDKKLLAAFAKLNNRNCYAYFTDEDSMSYHNLMEFLMLTEKALENRFGKSKGYRKSEVYEVLSSIIQAPTERQIKTLTAINKVMKKYPALFDDVKFDGIFKGEWDNSFYADNPDADFIEAETPDHYAYKSPKKKKKKKHGPSISSYDDIYDIYEDM